MIATITGIVLDGSTPTANVAPLSPFAQDLPIPQAEDTTVNLVVKNVAGAAVNITAGSLTFTAKQSYQDTGTPPISRLGVVDNGPSGLAHFTLVPGDTTPMLVFPIANFYDVEWIDGAGKRWQIVPQSAFRILPAYSLPGQPVTATPAQVSGIGFWNEGEAAFTSGGSNVVTVTLQTPHANTNYRVYTGLHIPGSGISVGVSYDIISASQFNLVATASFTGGVAWGTRP